METIIDEKNDKNEMILGLILLVILVTLVYTFLIKKDTSKIAECKKMLGEFSPLSNL